MQVELYLITKHTFNNAIAIGQSTFTGGNTLVDIHGVRFRSWCKMLGFLLDDHNTDKFFVGISGDTSGDALMLWMLKILICIIW